MEFDGWFNFLFLGCFSFLYSFFQGEASAIDEEFIGELVFGIKGSCFFVIGGFVRPICFDEFTGHDGVTAEDSFVFGGVRLEEE
jgi:hypothetical protein